MDWLILLFFFELGAIDGSMVQYTPELAAHNVPPFYSTLGVRAEASVFFVEGATRSDFMMQSINSYIPTQQTFTVGAGVNYKGFTIGYEHSCFHPITPYYTTDLERYQVTPKFEGGYDRVYIRAEMEVGR